MQIGILESNGFSAEALKKLKQIGDVHEFSGANLKQFLKPLTVLLVRLSYMIDKEFLSMTPSLQWLVSPTTGHTHIDEDELARRNIKLISLRGERDFLETIRATPENTFALIMALLRRHSIAFQTISSGKWDRDICRGEELFGNTVGIIGLGRVGFRLACYCDSFGASVNWFDPNPKHISDNWARLKSIEELIDKSRIIIMCASFLSGEPKIITKKHIETMLDKYFINTARAELVDYDALYNFAYKDKLAGLALDVLDSEHMPISLSRWQKIISNRNIVLTPHISGATFCSMRKTEIFVVDKLVISLKIL